MGHASTWKNPSTHITYKRGDKIVVTGTIQKSADGQSGTFGKVTKKEYYFYSYYTADWTVRAPICIGLESGSSWAFVTADAIVSGGTKESYIIKYDANGGSGAPGNQTKYYATNITLSKTVPTKKGYTFNGWNTKRDGTGNYYGAGATFKVNAATTLYAQWAARDGVQVWSGTIEPYGTSELTMPIVCGTYDLTGFKYLKPWLKVQNPNLSGTVEFMIYNSSGDLLKSGKYTGLQYKNSETLNDMKLIDISGCNGVCTVKITRSGHDNATAIDGAVYLYTAAPAVTTYSIAYNANGGSGAPASQTKTHDTTLKLRSEIPVRSGYRFVDWNTKSDGTGTSYDAGALYSVNAKATLYAQWEIEDVCAIKTATGWKFGQAYIKVNGKWVKGEHVYAKVNGTWKLGTR